jgi:uncharacterized membrane protein YcaP (DUF421 family)
MSTLELLFGTEDDLTALQMSARALVLVFVLLVLVRLAGRRMFGHRSSFDIVIMIMLGSVMSRAVVGVSPVLPTVAAAAMLCLVHRLVMLLTVRSPGFEALIKGPSRLLYRDGVYYWREMSLAGISKADLEEAARSIAQCSSLAEVHEVVMEPSGRLSVNLEPARHHHGRRTA